MCCLRFECRRKMSCLPEITSMEEFLSKSGLNGLHWILSPYLSGRIASRPIRKVNRFRLNKGWDKRQSVENSSDRWCIDRRLTSWKRFVGNVGNFQYEIAVFQSAVSDNSSPASRSAVAIQTKFVSPIVKGFHWKHEIKAINRWLIEFL